MVKTTDHEKFQKNRIKTVGGDAHTRYMLPYEDGKTDIRISKGREAEYYAFPPLFFETAGDNKT